MEYFYSFLELLLPDRFVGHNLWFLGPSFLATIIFLLANPSKNRIKPEENKIIQAALIFYLLSLVSAFIGSLLQGLPLQEAALITLAVAIGLFLLLLLLGVIFRIPKFPKSSY